MTNSIPGSGTKLRLIAYPIGVFAVVGTGVGMTAAVLVNVFGEGGGLLSGILFILVLSVALLLGPVVALVVGIQMSKREDTGLPIGSILGCSVGFLIMMGIILMMLVFGLGVASMGGEGGTDGDSTEESEFNLMEYIAPILFVSIPSGLTGGAASYLHSSFAFTDETTGSKEGAGGTKVPEKPDITIPSVPRTYLIGAGLVVVLLIAGAFGLSFLLEPISSILGDGATGTAEANIEASGSVDDREYNIGFATPVNVSNTGDEPVEAEVVVRIQFEGESREILTKAENITLDPNETRVLNDEFFWGSSELSKPATNSYYNGNYQIEFIVNGEVKDTVP